MVVVATKQDIKRLKEAIEKLEANISNVYTRVENLQEEVTTITSYLSEVSKIASNTNLPKYQPVKYRKITKFEIKDELKDVEYMSENEIEKTLKEIKEDEKK